MNCSRAFVNLHLYPITSSYLRSLVAYQDIDDITDFIANNHQQPLNATKVADAIFETIDKIAEILLHIKSVRKFLLKQKCTGR